MRPPCCGKPLSGMKESVDNLISITDVDPEAIAATANVEAMAAAVANNM